MPDTPASLAMPSAPPSPARRLWLKFLRTRGGRPGLIMIGAFMVIALLAPFIAHRLPFYWRDAETGALGFPLFREFFAPSDTTEPFLESGINFLLIFIPVATVVWLLTDALFPRLGKIESKAVSLLFGVMFSATLWVGLGGMIIQAGGDDWLRYENPPVPEIDDIANIRAFLHPEPPSDDMQSGIRRIVRKKLPDLERLRQTTLENAANANSLSDQAVRDILFAVQDAIDAEPIASITDIDAMGAIEKRGMADADLANGLNAARWNRILLERAYPGFLRPLVLYRTAFMLLVAACVLVLLGMTFIFMTGANQFSLSPRWLILLALAVIVYLPFLLCVTRNDQTPYRQLAAEGKGTGLFPLIPYGPNEQGFGPRLPPDWYVEAPKLEVADIVSWERLEDLLRDGKESAAAHIAALLRKMDADGKLPTDRGMLLNRLNALLDQEDVYDSQAFSGVRIDISLVPYMAALRDGLGLKGVDRARFNRLLLERALPSTLEGSAASRWKKPQHLTGNHFFGTDESGRDVLTRMIHGARVSLSVGFVSVALATIIGLVLGSLAAYYAGWVDMAISRFMEIMMCFPSFFLILAVIAVLDRRSILNIMLVIGLTSWTGVARLIRGEMLKHKKMDYVSASIALGASDARTIFRHILPNAMAPVLVSISFGITGAILTEASLSFIGFGVTPPTPTWGQLLSETRESPLATWWLALFPGLILFLGVFAYNLVGEALRDALDPRTTL